MFLSCGRPFVVEPILKSDGPDVSLTVPEKLPAFLHPALLRFCIVRLESVDDDRPEKADGTGVAHVDEEGSERLVIVPLVVGRRERVKGPSVGREGTEGKDDVVAPVEDGEECIRAHDPDENVRRAACVTDYRLPETQRRGTLEAETQNQEKKTWTKKIKQTERVLHYEKEEASESAD
jgi:hypothetical protein